MSDTRARDEKIAELYRRGMLLKHIAEQVGMAPNSVGVILKKLGFERPSKPQRRVKAPADIDARAAELWGHGLNRGQIAERLGVNENLVSASLTKLGLTSTHAPRHRYDGIGGIGKPGRPDKSAFARIARKT